MNPARAFNLPLASDLKRIAVNGLACSVALHKPHRLPTSHVDSRQQSESHRVRLANAVPLGRLKCSAMEHLPPIQFAPARGGRIAYQRFGEGTVPLVAIPPAAQNIEASWELPELRSMFTQLGSFCDYIHFDKRGTGASDTNQLVPGIDERVDDLRAVLDHAGLERAHLFAQSEGGPMTLLFAAAYPQRVLSVTLVGSGARTMPDGIDRDQQVALREIFADLWGTPDSMAVPVFVPSKLTDPDFVSWHQRYERVAASSAAIRDLMMQMMDWDVRDVLADIECPILVLHRTNDPAMPVELGEEVARLGKDTTFVQLPGDDHFCYVGEREWIDHLERFITGHVTPREPLQAQQAISITTLGRFAVTVDGNEVPTSAWGSRRARTLVKRLAAAKGWPVRREELADLLWPDQPDPAVWGARLSVQLSTVRRVLHGGIVADRQTISLDLQGVDVDLVRLLAAPSDADILEIYQGAFLPEEAAEEWRRAPYVEALTAARGAGHRLLTVALDAPDPERATQLANLLLSWDEFDEVAHDAAIAAADAAGDPAGAATARARREAAFS